MEWRSDRGGQFFYLVNRQKRHYKNKNCFLPSLFHSITYSLSFYIRANSPQFLFEVLIPTIKMFDSCKGRCAVCNECCNNEREAGANVWDFNFGGVQFRWSVDHRRVFVIHAFKSTRTFTKTIREERDVRPHFFECVCVAEAFFVNRFVHDRSSFGLCKNSDERLLPVGHKAWMCVGLELNTFQRPRSAKQNPVRLHFIFPTDSTHRIEKRHHMRMLCAADENFATRSDRHRSVRCGLDAVRHHCDFCSS